MFILYKIENAMEKCYSVFRSLTAEVQEVGVWRYRRRLRHGVE